MTENKRKKRNKTLAFWLIVLVLFFVFLWAARIGSTVGATGDDTNQSKTEEVKSEIEEVKSDIKRIENEIEEVKKKIFPDGQLDRYPVGPEAVIELLVGTYEKADAARQEGNNEEAEKLEARVKNIVDGDYLYVSGMRKLDSGTIIVDVFITVGHKVQKSPGITGVMIERSVKVAISGPVVSLNDLENKVREKIGKEHSNSPVFVNPAIEKTLAPDPGKPEKTPAVVPEPPPPLEEPNPLPTEPPKKQAEQQAVEEYPRTIGHFKNWVTFFKIRANPSLLPLNRRAMAREIAIYKKLIKAMNEAIADNQGLSEKSRAEQLEIVKKNFSAIHNLLEKLLGMKNEMERIGENHKQLEQLRQAIKERLESLGAFDIEPPPEPEEE